MDTNPLDERLASLTPSRLEALIHDLVAQQPAGSRRDVTLVRVVEALTEGLELGTGAAGWSAFLRVKRAIIAAVAQITGLRYIEGDA